MKRRDFLQLCGAAAGAYAITSRANASQVPVRSPKRLVLVFATGAWDTTYALDPKDPDHASVPAGATQMFGGLDVFCDASRPSVTAYFQRHADVSAIVRGIGVDAINHNECQRRIATGTREETKPDFGAVIAHELGNDLPLPYLILGDTAFTGPYAASSGRVGTTNQIVELIDPSSGGGGGLITAPGDGAAHADGPSDAELALLRDFANASAARARAIRGSFGYNRKRIDDFVTSIDRAAQLKTIKDAFGARGETQSYHAQVSLALDALEHDLAHAVMISTRLAWDTHADNAFQGGFHELTFSGLAQLLDQLKLRPGRTAGSRMIDDTVVVAFSEMSRTPYLAGTDIHAGKGHWPVTAALVAGAGVRGSQVFGATDPDTIALAIDLATGALDPNGTKPLYSHFVAGVMALCGVAPGAYLDSQVFDAFAL